MYIFNNNINVFSEKLRQKNILKLHVKYLKGKEKIILKIYFKYFK